MICDVHMSLFMCMLSGNLNMNLKKSIRKKGCPFYWSKMSIRICVQLNSKKVVKKGKSNNKKTTVFEKKSYKNPCADIYGRNT